MIITWEKKNYFSRDDNDNDNACLLRYVLERANKKHLVQHNMFTSEECTAVNHQHNKRIYYDIIGKIKLMLY